MPSVREERIETDLLIIGGGIAGAFAAIKAREAGCERVTLVSKGKLGRDSISSFAAGAFTMIFPEDDRGELIRLWGLSEAYGAGLYDEALLNVLIDGAIANGADVNVRDEMGRTPLMMACMRGNYKLCLLLSKSGANSKLEDMEGFRAFDYLFIPILKQDGSATYSLKKTLKAFKKAEKR